MTSEAGAGRSRVSKKEKVHHSAERDERDAAGCLGRWVGLPTVNLSLTPAEFLRVQPRQWQPPPNTAVDYCCLGDRTPFETRSVR